MDKIHDMIQLFKIDTRTPEATEATINNLLNIIQKLNDKINDMSSRNQILR